MCSRTHTHPICAGYSVYVRCAHISCPESWKWYTTRHIWLHVHRSLTVHSLAFGPADSREMNPLYGKGGKILQNHLSLYQVLLQSKVGNMFLLFLTNFEMRLIIISKTSNKWLTIRPHCGRMRFNSTFYMLISYTRCSFIWSPRNETKQICAKSVNLNTKVCVCGRIPISHKSPCFLILVC